MERRSIPSLDMAVVDGEVLALRLDLPMSTRKSVACVYLSLFSLSFPSSIAEEVLADLRSRR